LGFDLPDEIADLVGGGLGLQAQDADLQCPHPVVLLRPRRERPRCRAPQPRDELPPPHPSSPEADM